MNLSSKISTMFSLEGSIVESLLMVASCISTYLTYAVGIACEWQGRMSVAKNHVWGTLVSCRQGVVAKKFTDWSFEIRPKFSLLLKVPQYSSRSVVLVLN